MSDVTPPAPEPAPSAQPQPAYAQPAASDGKTLGIVALVVTFFVSLAGLIMGYVARSQSKKAGVKNTPATVAIVLGWIFLAFQLIWIILMITVFGSLAGQCAQYGPGVHVLPDGATLTCG